MKRHIPSCLILLAVASSAVAQSRDEHEAQLLEIRRQTEIATEQAKLLSKQNEIKQLQKSMGGTTATATDAPELARITRMRGAKSADTTAEFVVNGGTQKGRVGERIGGGWTITAIGSTSVTVTDDGGNERHLTLSGPAIEKPQSAGQ